jgi:DnaJ-class molecular chaperone
MSDRSPYEILGVSPEVDTDGLRRAFRAIARTCHPDIAGDDPAAAARFREAREAWEILSDPVRRAQLHAVREPARPSRRREDREAFFSAMMRRAARGDGPDKGDPFESMFADAEASPRASAAWDPTDPFADPPEPARAAPPQAAAPTAKADAVIDVSVAEAMLGAWIDLDTPAGPTRVVLPPGSSSGAQVTAPGRGVQGPGGVRADWTIAVRIVVPDDLDERARELVRELAKRLPPARR